MPKIKDMKAFKVMELSAKGRNAVAVAHQTSATDKKVRLGKKF